MKDVAKVYVRMDIKGKETNWDGINLDELWLWERPKIVVIIAVKSAALNMPANLENSAVATGLEKVFSFQRKAMP